MKLQTVVASCLSLGCVLIGVARAQDSDPGEDATGLTIATMHVLADELKAITTTPLVREFLGQVGALPQIEPRTIYRDPEDKSWHSEDPHSGEGFEPREITERDYYDTKYGTPLMYALALDALARTVDEPFELDGARVCDYGCGGMGHLRLLGAGGADAVGVDVDSYLEAIYSRDGDMGPMPDADGAAAGRARLVTGSWPSDEATARAVGGGYTLFSSKNTLKHGYVHPREEGGEPLLKMGVTPLEFLRAIARGLEPGGYALIYNLSPAQLPPDEGFIPWADGRCPFSREQFEDAGFEVLALDEVDDERARRAFQAAGYPTQKDGEENLFALFTVARKR